MTDAAAPARPTFLLLPLAFVNFPVGAGAFLVIGMLSPLAQSLSMSKVQAGWVMSAYALGYALTSPVLSALTGPLRRRTANLTGIARSTGMREAATGEGDACWAATITSSRKLFFYRRHVAGARAASMAEARIRLFSHLCISEISGNGNAPCQSPAVL